MSISPNSSSDGSTIFSGSRKSFDIGKIPASSLSFKRRYASLCAQFFSLKNVIKLEVNCHKRKLLYGLLKSTLIIDDKNTKKCDTY